MKGFQWILRYFTVFKGTLTDFKGFNRILRDLRDCQGYSGIFRILKGFLAEKSNLVSLNFYLPSYESRYTNLKMNMFEAFR